MNNILFLIEGLCLLLIVNSCNPSPEEDELDEEDDDLESKF